MNDAGELFCLSPGGDLVWRTRIPGIQSCARPIEMKNGGFLVPVNSRLYFVSGEGKIHAESHLPRATPSIAECGNGNLAIYPVVDKDQKRYLAKMRGRSS